MPRCYCNSNPSKIDRTDIIKMAHFKQIIWLKYWQIHMHTPYTRIISSCPFSEVSKMRPTHTHGIRVKLTNRESNHWKGNMKNFVFITRWVIRTRIGWIDFDRTRAANATCFIFYLWHMSICVCVCVRCCEVREISCERIVWLHDYTSISNIWYHLPSISFDICTVYG